MKFSCCQSTSTKNSNALNCSGCNNKYHLQCVLPSKTDANVNSDFIATWLCPKCVLNKPKPPKNDNTPVRTSDRSEPCQESNVTMRKKTQSTLSPSNPAVTLDQIRDIIRAENEKLRDDIHSTIMSIVASEFKAFKEEITSLKDSVTFISNEYDALTERVKTLESNVKLINPISVDMDKIKASIEKSVQDNNTREQWARRSNIEIFGIPEKKGENLMNIVQEISNRAGLSMKMAEDVDFITRVAPRKSENGKPKPIVVRFLARYKKDDFLSSVRKMKKFKACDLGFSGVDSLIYFNDHLTSENKALLQRVKTLAKDKNYKYVWIKNCSIMIRRSDNSPVINISNCKDLNKIK